MTSSSFNFMTIFFLSIISITYGLTYFSENPKSYYLAGNVPHVNFSCKLQTDLRHYYWIIDWYDGLERIDPHIKTGRKTFSITNFFYPNTTSMTETALTVTFSNTSTIFAEFYCVAYNYNNTMKLNSESGLIYNLRQVTLKGNPKSQIKRTYNSLTIERGDILELPLHAKYKFEWESAPLNEQTQDNFNRIKTTNRVFVTSTGQLVFAYLIKNDSRRYKPILKIEGYRRNHTIEGDIFKLTVKDPDGCRKDCKVSVRMMVRNKTIKALINSAVTLECIATGSPAPKLDWCHYPKLSHSCLPVRSLKPRVRETADKQYLTISKVTLDDHHFVCYASNSHSFASGHFYIKARENLRWIRPPSSEVSVSPLVNEHVFSCPYTGGKSGNPTIIWSRNSDALDEDLCSRGAICDIKNEQITFNISAGTSNSLRETNVDCRISDYPGSLSAATFVTIHNVASSLIRSPPKVIATEVGSNAMFHCLFVGSPRPLLEYYYNEKRINVISLHYQTFFNGTLLIINVTKNDEGFYSCKIASTENSNNFTISSSNTTMIRVYNKTKIESKFISDIRKESDSFDIYCKFTFDGEINETLSTYWNVKGKRFDEGPRLQATQVFYNNNSGINTLHYKNSEPQDTGRIECVVEYTAGTPIKTFKTTVAGFITISGIPQSPYNVQIKKSEYRTVLISAEIGWNFNYELWNNTIPIGFGIYCKQKANSSYTLAANGFCKPFIFEKTLILVPNSNRTCHIVAISNIGRGIPSKSFQLENRQKIVIENVTVSCLKNFRILISWAPLTIWKNSNNFSYTIYIKKVKQISYDRKDIIKISSHILKNAIFNTSYQIKVGTRNLLEGFDVNSTVKIIKCSFNSLLTPTNLMVNGSELGLNVDWKGISAAKINFNLAGYVLYIKKFDSLKLQMRETTETHLFVRWAAFDEGNGIYDLQVFPFDVRNISGYGSNVYRYDYVDSQSTASYSSTPVSQGSRSGAVFSGVGVTIFVVVIAAIVIYWRRKRRKDLKNRDKSPSPTIKESMLTLVSSGVTSQQNLNIAEVKSNEYIEAKSHDKWEYPKSKLTLGDELGHGAYGQVVQGEAIDIQDHVGITVVAVKMLKSDALDIERRSLLAELDMLKSLDKHQNIISLLGCCTYEAPLLIIVEFACHGDLLKYLRSNRGDGDFGNLTLERLTEIAWQISNGMTYLEQMKLIHRDLAARNVLLDEDYNCKISDFGLARDVYESNLYTRSSRSRLPVKWMALESIFDDIWTTKSDVWSFGVVVWEIFTLGSFPYPGMTAAETTEKVRNGYRMEKPQNCPNEIYQIISDCWSEDYRNRPSFDKVKLRLEYYRESTDSYLTLEEGESVQA